MEIQTIKTKLITAFMETNNLSKTAFCNLCKISLNTLNNILANKDNLKILALFKIARVMNVKIQELFIY